MSATPLEGKIRWLIEANGPIGVDEYMRLCLADPQHGYYVARDPLGAAGDFITAPEISQMFGEIVGAWLIHAWELCGRPDAVRLVELGPGRGTLMRDILRVAARRPEFLAAIAVDLVEQNVVLRKSQAARLAGISPPPRWHDTFETVAAGPLLLVANEFFDALPIRQFVRRDGAWRERMVGLDAGGTLAFGLGPSGFADLPDAPDGAVLETSPVSLGLADAVASRIACDNGAALLIDYGHAEPGFGDTLQAVSGHAFTDPLARPGEVDLTAHVDFSALRRRAVAAGAAAHGPLEQGEFLRRLGLHERAARLGRNADAASRRDIDAAVERLAGPAAMGRLFKVLAITRREIVPPPFSSV